MTHHPATRPTATGTTVRVSQTTDATSPDYGGPCPRGCGHMVPNDAEPGAYPGALSRVDNATYICSSCGTAEAMWNFQHPTVPLPPVTIPVGVPEPVATDSRVSFGIVWLATEAEADYYATIVKATGQTYNGGYMHGLPCGRAPEFDRTADGVTTYAVTVA